MPKVTHVKKARRALPDHDIKVGDEYWWWSSKMGRYFVKHYSKTPPKPSQLTGSEFHRTLLEIEEDYQNQTEFQTADDLSSALQDIYDRVESLKNETQDKLDNMPEGLQQGPTGEMLQNRVDELDTWLSEIDPNDMPDREDFESDEDFKAELESKWQDVMGNMPSPE